MIDRAEPTTHVTGQIRDKGGSLAVYALGDISVIAHKKMRSRDPSALAIKPGRDQLRLFNSDEECEAALSSYRQEPPGGLPVMLGN